MAPAEELKSLLSDREFVSEWVEVSQERINRFAEATGDTQWIHLDAECAARESPFGSTIAHGFLTLSLLSDLLATVTRVRDHIRIGLNYGLNRVRFTSPVPAGSHVRARFRAESCNDIDSGVQVIWNATVEIEGAPKPALVAEWVVRYYT